MSIDFVSVKQHAFITTSCIIKFGAWCHCLFWWPVREGWLLPYHFTFFIRCICDVVGSSLVQNIEALVSICEFLAFASCEICIIQWWQVGNQFVNILSLHVSQTALVLRRLLFILRSVLSVLVQHWQSHCTCCLVYWDEDWRGYFCHLELSFDVMH